MVRLSVKCSGVSFTLTIHQEIMPMEMSKLLPKKTKIICTIGPASSEQRVLESMIMNGMNIARINFAHGNFDGHRRTIANIRAASDAVGRRVAIFGDLPGPKMRIGRLAEEPIEIERGQPFTLKTKKCIGNADYVSMNFEELPKVVEPGNSIFLNDGFIQLEVEDVQEDRVHCRVLVGGELRSNKGINLPDIDLGIDVFTQRDLEYLHFAASQELDGISQSFVESAADIRTVREAAQAIGYDPFIIAKIERSRALENLQQILEETDGMMVARGDLGVEIPIERIATTQKKIIAAANLLGKPVITATHMLESMINSRRPTRAEATDVANAILDGTDCVMLSGETAIGSYPIDAVTVMSHIAEETEQHAENFHVAVRLELQEAEGEISREDLIAQGIYRSALTLQPAVVFVPSDTGSTARLVTRFRMQQWLIAPSLKQKTCQRLEFSYGIFPEFIPENPDSWPKYVKNWLDEHKIECDLVLVIQGGRTVRSGDTIRMDIIDLSDA